MTKPERFKVGDRVFKPSSSWTAQPKPCPVCDGTTRILAKAEGAPDERGTTMSCEYCKWAERDGLKRGYVVEDWGWAPHVQEIVIEGIQETNRPGKKETEYLFNCTPNSWNSVNHDDVYPDRDSAVEAAQDITRKAQGAPKAGEKPNPSYTVGYMRNQIKKAEAEVERWKTALFNRH